MQENTEGMLIAGYCLITSLLTALQARGDFNKAEITHIYDSASLALAELTPDVMSPRAREFANGLLEKFLKNLG